MKILKNSPCFIILTALIISCSAEVSNGSSEEPSGGDSGSTSETLSKKVMITNAGDETTGTLTYIDKEGNVTNDFFQFQNDGAVLGNNVQSITFGGGDYNYIAVDQYIIVVDKYFEYQSIYYGGLSDPQDMIVIGGVTGYAINWGTTAEQETPYITLVGIEAEPWLYEKGSYILLDTYKPEKIIYFTGDESNKFYITNYESNILTCIDLSEQVSYEELREPIDIELNDNADDLFAISDAAIAVLSKGDVNGSVAAIQEIDVESNTVTKTISFSSGEYPTAMVYSDNYYYYSLNNQIYKLSTSASSTSSSTSVLDVTFTDFAIDGDTIYGVNVATNGASTFSAYDLSSGELLLTTEAGTNANNVYLFD